MVKGYKEILKSYFNEHSFTASSIHSFNRFINKTIFDIIKDIGDIVPTVIPPDIEDFRIKLENIKIGTPEIVEADGSRRKIFPMEARLRKLTYSSPIILELTSYIDGMQRETVKMQVGSIPIMVKSDNCSLHGLNKEELIKKGEDPNDPGGYFIINGTERVIINIEDLASNKIFVEKNKIGPSVYTTKVFSEKGSFRIPHVIEQMKDGVLYLTFTRAKRIPVIAVIKALGLEKDFDINSTIGLKNSDIVFINLNSTASLRGKEDAKEFLARKMGLGQLKEQKIERVENILDKYLLPHVGISNEDRILKAKNLCKIIKKHILVSTGKLDVDDKDHYMNKRLKLAGDLLADLFRINLRILITDMLYNFQRLVKRGKFPSIKIIIREKLLTSRIYSSMATGSWGGGRQGISQHIDRLNYMSALSHLQRVVSPLSASQENFDARALHATHFGRLCPIETPEGTNIGLRKNLSLLCEVSPDLPEKDILSIMEDLGMKSK